MNTIISKVWKVITDISLILIIFLAIVLVGVRLFGFRVYTIVSGSMKPEYKVGSLIYVKPINVESLKVNDVISFEQNGSVVTHRIVDIISEDDDISYQTKGDANDTPDGNLVKGKDIKGKVVFKIPIVGFIASFIRNKSGRYLLLTWMILIIVSIFIPTSKKSKKSIERNTSDDKEKIIVN